MEDPVNIAEMWERVYNTPGARRIRLARAINSGDPLVKIPQ